MLRKIQGLLHFAKNIWAFTSFVSIAVWFLTSFAIGEKFMLLFGYISMIKFATYLFIFFLYHFLNQNKYLFYQNLGLNKAKLWAFSLIIDFLVFPFSIYMFLIIFK